MEVIFGVHHVATNLVDGSIVTFESPSRELDQTKPLESQMHLVPRGFWIKMLGYDELGNQVEHTVSWNYGGSNYCQSEPLSVGDTIGLVELESYELANAAFCPAVTPYPTLSPTSV